MSETDYSQHPAAKGFNYPSETFKHVAAKALKWAAYGALIAGALSLLPALMTTGIANIPIIGTFFAANAGAAMIAKAMATCAAAFGALGAVKGIADAKEAVDEKLHDRIAEWEGNEVANERRQAMALQRQQALSQAAEGQAPVVAPNIGAAVNRGQGVGVGQ